MEKHKKELLPALLCGTLACGIANCSDANSVDNCSDAVNLAPYTGWYLGAGLSHQYTRGEALLDDNLGDVTNSSDAHGFQLVSSHPGKIGGTLVAGYGKLFLDRLYLGAEVSCDITGNEDRTRRTDYGDSKLKTRGWVPTLALRLGGVLHSWNCMFYGRFGFAFWDNKFESPTFSEKVSSRKFTPIIGLGVEKMFANKLSIRLEGDYRFGADRTKSNLATYNPDGTLFHVNYRGHVNSKVRGFASRLVCTYHF